MRNAMTTTAIALVLALSASHEALAYSTYETTRGDLVRWNRTRITVTLDDNLALLGDIDDIENTITAAFDDWVDSASLPMEFEFVRGSCVADGYSEEGANVNCITADDAFFDGDPDAAATTLLSYVDQSGEIRDADIIIHAEPGMWASSGHGGKHDLAAALLHEVGHFLGMSHSDVEEAIMYPTLGHDDDGDTADLHQDDLAGVSFLYEGFAPPVEMTCSVVATGSSTGSSSLFSLLFAGSLLVIVRARRRR